MRILSLTHGPLVRSEVFGDVLREKGHEEVEWDIAAQGPPSEAAGYDAVMVFGGSQNVGEELAHPWLEDEYELLRGWVVAGTPLFCVCLGAQTLSYALGGKVGRVSPAPLAGFYDTELTEAGAADPVLGVLPRRFEAFNANGYAFTVPAGGVELATGPVAQACRVGERAWAVQFHPEVRRDQALAWFAEDRPSTKPLPVLERELDAKLPAWQEHGRRLCRAFLAAAR